MRILHVIPSLAPEMGGPPRVALRLAAAQADLGHEVRVVTYSAHRPEEVLHALHVSPAEVRGVRLHTIAPGGLRELLWAPALAAFIAGLRDRCDVIHAHGVWEIAIVRAVRLARRLGKVGVVTPHGMVSDYGMRQKPWKKALGLSLYARGLFESASFAHVLTATEQAEFNRYLPAARSRVVPNGVILGEFDSRPSRDLVDAALPRLAGRPYVLFLARIDPMKGIDLLVEAFAEVTRSDGGLGLVIAGPDAGYRATIESLVDRFGVRDRVEFAGLVDGELKRALLVHAVCLVQPSRHEGFSLSILEALASGTPAVVSDRVDVPGLVAERAGVVTGLDAAAIAAAILGCPRDAVAREQMARRARGLVEQRYTWRRVATDLLAAYAESAGR
jgi:glycosyltransferase involved in cell wall biosynthesis